MAPRWMLEKARPLLRQAEDFDSVGAPQLHARACENSLMSQVVISSKEPAALTHTPRLLINIRPPVNHMVRLQHSLDKHP